MSKNSTSIRLEPEYYEVSEATFAGFKLYKHQEQVIHAFQHTKNDIVLQTPTASGKTLAALGSLYLTKTRGIFIYPTNALLQDQARSIITVLQDKLKQQVIIYPKAYAEQLGLAHDEETARKAQVRINILTGAIINIEYANYKEKQLNNQSRNHITREITYSPYERANILAELLLPTKQFTITLMNFDVLTYMAHFKYLNSTSLIQYLLDYEAIIIDEFHMYQGYELGNIIHGMHYLDALVNPTRKENAIPHYRKIILTATLHQDSKRLLEKALYNPVFFKVTPKQRSTSMQETLTPATGPVNLVLLNYKWQYTETDYQKIMEIMIKHFSDTSNRNPLVIILNEPRKAREFYDKVKNNDTFKDATIHLRTGWQHGFSKLDTKTPDILIGTSAIEVGIDFTTTHLIFEATENASFFQRLGRVGRKTAKPSYAYALVNPAVKHAIHESQPTTKAQLKKTLQYAFENTDNPLIAYSHHPLSTSTYYLALLYALRQIMNTKHVIKQGAQLYQETFHYLKALINALFTNQVLTHHTNQKWLNIKEIEKAKYKYDRISLKAPKTILPAIRELGFRSDPLQLPVYDPLLKKDKQIPYYTISVKTALERMVLDPVPIDNVEFKILEETPTRYQALVKQELSFLKKKNNTPIYIIKQVNTEKKQIKVQAKNYVPTLTRYKKANIEGFGELQKYFEAMNPLIYISTSNHEILKQAWRLRYFHIQLPYHTRKHGRLYVGGAALVAKAIDQIYDEKTG